MLLLSPVEVEDYQNKIAGIILDIANQEKLVGILEDLYLNRISPYDYKRIKFVIQNVLEIEPLQEVAKKKLAILEILSNYRRQNQPTLDELVTAKERCKCRDI
jgi:hypothetical protein